LWLLLKVSYDATKIAFSNTYPVAEYYARTVKITLLLKHIKTYLQWISQNK